VGILGPVPFAWAYSIPQAGREGTVTCFLERQSAPALARLQGLERQTSASGLYRIIGRARWLTLVEKNMKKKPVA